MGGPCAQVGRRHGDRKANTRVDTRQELAVRRLLHARGLRYRVDLRLRIGPAPRQYTKADVCFTRARLAVFLDGCFWHACPEHLHRPKHNADYWARKLALNRARDARNTAALEALGWSVLRAWEHEPAAAVADRIERRYRALLAR